MSKFAKITIPIDLLKDTIYYLLRYAKDELSCVDPQLIPSDKVCIKCPFNPCELVEVNRIVKELAVIAVRHNLELVNPVLPDSKVVDC